MSCLLSLLCLTGPSGSVRCVRTCQTTQTPTALRDRKDHRVPVSVCWTRGLESKPVLIYLTATWKVRFKTNVCLCCRGVRLCCCTWRSKAAVDCLRSVDLIRSGVTLTAALHSYKSGRLHTRQELLQRKRAVIIDCAVVSLFIQQVALKHSCSPHWSFLFCCFQSELKLISERLTLHHSAPYTTPAEFLFDIWTLFKQTSSSQVGNMKKLVML